MKLFYLIIVAFLGVCANAQEQFAVYFDSGKFTLSSTEEKRLNDWMQTHPDVKIVAINGYTDEDGTHGYNDTLSQKRVQTIFAKVKDKIKIRDDYKSRSFGENFQQSKNKAENRKATIYYILAKDIPRENEILGIKPEPKAEVVTEIVPIEEEEMHFPEGAKLTDKIELARPGTLIRLEDINFYQNTFAMMPTSKRAMDELIYVMNKYPKLKIEIQGHICCVDKDVKNLSLERARQVKRVLVSEGISERRIFVKGFGTSKPKYTIPEKSDYEAARNRRVEIMVLSK